MAGITLWGFSGSTYVRTVRMVLAEKGVRDYRQVPVNVVKGEGHSGPHRARHPFGKVPVVEVDGFRVLETGPICRYLDAVLPGRAVYPADVQDRARADMATALVDAYGYPAMVRGIIIPHLAPHLLGTPSEAARGEAAEATRVTLTTLMGLRGADPWISGPDHSVADYFLAPIIALLALTPHGADALHVEGMGEWWESVSALASFNATTPD